MIAGRVGLHSLLLSQFFAQNESSAATCVASLQMSSSHHALSRFKSRVLTTLFALTGALAFGCDAYETSAEPDSGAWRVDLRRYEQGLDGAVPADGSCPFAQWDCTQLAPACSRDVVQGSALGCFCNRSRPLTIEDCGADEKIYCLDGTQTSEQAWNGRAQIQCACAGAPPNDQSDVSMNTCLRLFEQSATTMKVVTPPEGGCGRNFCPPPPNQFMCACL